MSTFGVYFLFSTAWSVWPFLWFEWYDNYHTNKSKEGNNNTSPITPPLPRLGGTYSACTRIAAILVKTPLAWDSARPWQSSVETTLWIRAWAYKSTPVDMRSSEKTWTTWAVEKLRSNQFWWTFSSEMVFWGRPFRNIFCWVAPETYE